MSSVKEPVIRAWAMDSEVLRELVRLPTTLGETVADRKLQECIFVDQPGQISFALESSRSAQTLNVQLDASTFCHQKGIANNSVEVMQHDLRT